MELAAYTVAPLIHYAPFYTALARLQQEEGVAAYFPPCETDSDLILKACRSVPKNKGTSEKRIVLALTSTTDLGRDATYLDTVRLNLGILTTLIPRVPLWYVCARGREVEISEAIDNFCLGSARIGNPLNVACYPQGTTSFWIVSNSFPRGSIVIKPDLTFRNDELDPELLKHKYNIAVTLHPWRYKKHFCSSIAIVRGPPSAPFGFTATLFHKGAIGDPELEQQLSHIRKLIFEEISDLYACFELPGFDWRRHKRDAPLPKRPEDYVRKLRQSLESLQLTDDQDFSNEELTDGLTHLAQSRTWDLPEAALEEIADSPSPLESFRAIREHRADQHVMLSNLKAKQSETEQYVLQVRASMPALARLIQLYFPAHSWDLGNEQIELLQTAIKEEVFPTTSHDPTHHRDGRKILDATNNSKLTVPLNAFLGVLSKHGFDSALIDEMFQQWHHERVNETVVRNWQGNAPAVASVCLAYTLYTGRVPAHWIWSILKNGSCKCAFEPFENEGGHISNLHVLNTEVGTASLMHSLLAFHTIGKELREAKAQWLLRSPDKMLTITGFIPGTREHEWRKGLRELLKRFQQIQANLDPFDKSSGRLQTMTLTFKALHDMGVTWSATPEAWEIDNTAKIHIRMSARLGLSHSDYRL